MGSAACRVGAWSLAGLLGSASLVAVACTSDTGAGTAAGATGGTAGIAGLDMIVIGRDLTPFGPGPSAPGVLWDAVRPAVIAADPRFRGDEAAFCAAYGANAYAPDLRPPASW